MTDRTIVAVTLVLAFLAFVILALPADDDRAGMIFVLILFSPLLFFVAVVGAMGPSRRERKRYEDYLSRTCAAGRSIDDELKAEAIEYAYRRPWVRDREDEQ